MDSCGRSRTATTQLIEFLPQLQINNNKSAEENLPFKLCVIDDVGLEKEVDVQKSLEELKIPVIGTNINTNSVSVLMDAVYNFLQEFQWERFAVIYSNSKFSSSLVKNLIKTIKKNDFCIPWMLNVDDEGIVDELQNVVIKSKIPLVSLLTSEEHYLLFKNLPKTTNNDEEFFDKKRRWKNIILFTDVVSREDLKIISNNKSVRVFSIVAHPEKENNFENYFMENSILPGMKKKMEDELDLIERTKTVQKIKKIGERISKSLIKAVEKLCHPTENPCTNFSSTSGREIIKNFLDEPDNSWSDNEKSYQLVEYLFQFSDSHVHLHKVRLYS